MSRITSLNNKFQFQDFLIGLYRRNKYLLIISAAIFFVSIVVGVFIGYFMPRNTEQFLTSIINSIRSAHIKRTTISIFMNNFRTALFLYGGGIVGIVTAVELGFNGYIYGSFLGFFSQGGVINHYGVSTPLDFIIYTLPHGVVEIPATIIAGAAGFRLTTLVISLIQSMIEKTPLNVNYWKFSDSIALLVIAIILFFIAAIIEANITPALGNYITGLRI